MKTFIPDNYKLSFVFDLEKKNFQTIQITVRRTTYFARPHQIRKKQWL